MLAPAVEWTACHPTVHKVCHHKYIKINISIFCIDSFNDGNSNYAYIAPNNWIICGVINVNG
jgi:hypothetical protein